MIEFVQLRLFGFYKSEFMNATFTFSGKNQISFMRKMLNDFSGIVIEKWGNLESPAAPANIP